MHRRTVVWLVLALAGCGGSSAAPPQPTPAGPRLTARTERALTVALEKKVGESGAPGAAAAVIFPDGREWTRAIGLARLEPRQPMTATTTLPLASVTKMTTAALALRLQEQRKLNLDDPVRRWYRAWRGDPGATVRELLGHRAGTRDPPEAFFRSQFEHPHRVTPRRFAAAGQKPGPRTDEPQYSDVGVVIAGLVLAQAAGEPVDTLMRRELFGHRGGTGLALQPAEIPHAPRAHTYWYPNGLADPTDTRDGSPFLPNAWLAEEGNTASALAGDVPSIARWVRELSSGRILLPASMQQMTDFHRGGPWEAYGLGLALDSYFDRPMWGHTGNGPGARTEVWYLPKQRLTVAVSWNDDPVEGDSGILNALLAAALAG